MVLATNDGVPIVESGRNEEISKAFTHLADLFEPEGAASADGGRSGLRLFKRKG